MDLIKAIKPHLTLTLVQPHEKTSYVEPDSDILTLFEWHLIPRLQCKGITRIFLRKNPEGF